MSTRTLLMERVESLPQEPGVYLFKDSAGGVIYVGKAKSLRARVRSYFQNRSDGRVAAHFIEERVEDVEVIVTRSEKEAFLLENNLIKQNKPRFNIRLKDDKSFLHLRVDRGHPFPAIVPMRRPRKDGALYLGPYASARAIRTTLRMVRGIFPLRDCSDHEFANRSRPCLKYQIKMCSAPCVGYVSEEQYRQDLDGAIRVLKGETRQIAEQLLSQMQEAASRFDFERAAVLRDRIAFLRNSTDVQAVEVSRFVDRDVFGLHLKGDGVAIAVLKFRAGKLLSQESFSFEAQIPADETLSTFLTQYYQSGRSWPDEIILPEEAYASEVLAQVLSERRGKPVVVRVPRSGEAARASEMAGRNAELLQQSEHEQLLLSERILEDVRRQLALRRMPRRIECIDVSHLQGAHAVASLVCFVDGEPEKSGYRRFRLRVGNDDPGAVREVVSRRFRNEPGDFPDLLLIDGGRAQVNAARSVLQDLDLDIELAGMVKPPRRGRGVRLRPGEEERIVRPDREDAILPPDADSCFLLQRVRDEAHRFAITYHRRSRLANVGPGELLKISGMGARRVRNILEFIGGLKELKAASKQQLANAPGIGTRLAERVYAALHAQGG